VPTIDQTAYDYIIVGAGSAGCTLAGRLSEDRDISVLLLEAGGWDGDPLNEIPMLWARNAFKRRHDWGYSCEPEKMLAGQSLPMFRGKIIGGSSSINAMTYVRGHRADYDRWAGIGLRDWSYAHVLPYFKKQETWEGGANKYRGGSGPLTTTTSRYDDPLGEALLAAGSAAGYPSTPDYNGEEQEGFTLAQLTVSEGRRCSVAKGYLRSAQRRHNLNVQVRAHTAKIVLDHGKAVGVIYRQNGRLVTVRADREVILCGGSINSPQLLMLSGIGDPEELRRHSIDVTIALPAVGKNLREHITADVGYIRTQSGPLHHTMRIDRTALALAQAHFFGSGIFTSVPNHVMAFLKALPDSKIPDLQLQFRMGPTAATPYLRPFNKPYVDGFGCRPVVLRPESIGRLSLRSADPFAAARIDLNLYSAERDRNVLRAGIRITRDILRQKPLERFAKAELAPGIDCNSDSEFDAYIHKNAMAFIHPLGTCKMGLANDETAVVDPELRVRGIDKLRVVDASIMPDHIGANLNSPVVMVAEKAADMIRGRSPAPATQV
jgi:4-pyridoxate dehydrogenase